MIGVARHLDRKWAWLLLALIAALPVLVARVPDLSDMPNHLARHHIFAMVGKGGPLDQYFLVHWRWIGNLGVDLPVMALAPWFGAEAATRLMAALIAPLTVLGILTLSRSVHGRVTASAMLALPFALSQPFVYGFLNYTLGVALALILSAWWLARPRRGPGTILVLVAASLVVWTAHIMGWAILLLIVGGAELATLRNPRNLLASAIRLLPFFAPLVPLLLWRHQSAGPLFVFEDGWLSERILNFLIVLKGLDRWFDIVMTAIVGVAAMLAFAWATAPRAAPRLAIPGLFLALATLAMPGTVLGSWGADMRLAPVAVMIAIMAIGPAREPAREKALILIGLALFAARVGYAAILWKQDSDVMERQLTMLDAVPRGSRMGFLFVRSDCDIPWRLTPDHKLGAYAIARRDVFSNTLFRIPGADLMIARSMDDRAHWFDGSQDVPARCPQLGINFSLLDIRMNAMAKAGFGTIWIKGVDSNRLVPPTGYRIVRSVPDNVLIAAIHPILRNRR